MLASIYMTVAEGSVQSKVISSLATIQRPGNWAEKWETKMNFLIAQIYILYRLLSNHA